MKRFTLVLFALLVSVPALAQKGKPPARAPEIPYTEYRLDNGLRVIFHQDRSTPIVAVNVWYHAGSKNEVPGKTGFAHLFEHMMFQGSKGWPHDYFFPLQEAGGTLNGSTNPDRTNYWEVVPSNFLELALFLEADRMANLLEAMTEEKLANQRDVVKNEKRQRYDNSPYGLVGAKIAATLYPPDHPYHWLTIGSLEDLTAASMDDVKDFFRRFYTPNNASLAIAGDFDPAVARRLVQKYFGPIERGPMVKRVSAEQPKLENEVRVSMEDRVSLPRIYMVWPTSPQYSADEAALDTLAQILGSGKSSRLYKSLVYEKQIAQEVNVFNATREIAGALQIIVTAKPGRTLDEIEKAVDQELARLREAAPPEAEVERAYNQVEASTIYALQTVGGFGGKSDQLNQYVIYRNDPGWLDEGLARYRAVKPSDVHRVARQYLTPNRLVLTVVPRSTKARPAATPPASAAPAPSAAAAPQPEASGRPSTAGLPKPKADPKLKLPKMERRRLSNGLDVRIVEHHELPVVGMVLVVKNGAAADPVDLAGLATLTADLLDEGTAKRSALQISDELANIGARLSASASWDSTNVSLVSLSRHLDKALEVFADVVINPAFADKEVARLRAQRLTALKQRRDNANEVATDVFARLVFGPAHPYGHPLLGDEAMVSRIGAEEVTRFYRTYYRPGSSSLIVVGDVTPSAILAKLEKALEGWKNGEVPAVKIATPDPREQSAIYLVDKPGAAQSVIAMGHVGVPRSTADFFPLLVMNTMLGGQFTSRLNMNLRETRGYTYGARSTFDYRKAAGPFVARAGVHTAVTRESVIEFLKELRGIRGAIPVSEDELQFAKQAIIRGFPRTFETSEQIANRLVDLVLYDLPSDYFNRYIDRVAAVTREEVERVARKYLDPGRAAILIVGDVQAIESGLRSLEDVGTTVTVLNVEGEQLPAAQP